MVLATNPARQYPVRRRRHAFPTLRPARGPASRILLGGVPLLRRLRGWFPSVVRRPQRSYGLIRLFPIIHHQIQFSLSSCGPSTRGDMKTSQGPDRRRADVHGFLDTVGSPGLSPERNRVVLASTSTSVSPPQTRSFRCSISPAHPYRCRHFAGPLTRTCAQLAESRGWLSLQHGGLAPPTFCQFAWHTAE